MYKKNLNKYVYILHIYWKNKPNKFNTNINILSILFGLHYLPSHKIIKSFDIIN